MAIMAARNSAGSAAPWLGAALALAIVAWRFPLFHVVPLSRDRAPPVSLVVPREPSFDPSAFAQNFWTQKLLPATAGASEAATVLTALRRDPVAAAKQHAHQVGIGGTAYYFVRGTGRVVSVARNEMVVAVDGAEGAQIALRFGPLFGNTVRDGTGLLNVNEFPGLAEFNALAAELNRIVEAQVFPALRNRARVGAALAFAGCAEAPEGVAVSGPLLVAVPVQIHDQP
jgi:predicted lipoprotein